jgi:hypothetical protein
MDKERDKGQDESHEMRDARAGETGALGGPHSEIISAFPATWRDADSFRAGRADIAASMVYALIAIAGT